MIKVCTISIWICLLCGPLFLHAQGKLFPGTDDKVARIEANRKTAAPFSILFNESADYKENDLPQLFTRYLGLRSGTDELRPAASSQHDKVTANRYQQYFQNIKVEHGSSTVNIVSGKISSITGDFYTIDMSTRTSPVLSETTSLDLALAAVHADVYKWQLPAEEQFLKRETGDPHATFFPKGELVWVEDFRTGAVLNGQVHLAYKFDIYAQRPVIRSNVYVDAMNGQILFADAEIKHAANPSKYTIQRTPSLPAPFATGTAASRYSGSLAIPTQLSGSYKLQAALATEGYPLHTLNLQKTTTYASAVEFTDADNNWTAAEFNNANFDNAALDAHWGAAKVYDYWKIKHGRNGFNNANAITNSYVHYGTAYDNAYWDGVRMTYGDGSNLPGGFTPLTSLDVVAHEIGHAICQYTANLVYNRESGAMNEGFSDIWGAAVEHYADPFESDATPKVNFLIGEEISVGSPALRSMSDPKSLGQPDTYLGTYWADVTTGGCPTPSDPNDNCGVHTNSGILNYWFYLMVAGKSSTNDIGNVYSVPAIGWTDAEKIAYLAETNLGPTATYAACRTASVNAATALFGACSLQTEAVTRAWYAVNVGTDFVPCTPQVIFTGISQTVTETGSAGATCLKTKSVSVPVRITAAPTQPATVTFALSGTAANGAALDYTITPATVVFPAGSSADQNLVITLNNDAYIENTETIILTINGVATTGNAAMGNAFQQYTINVTDDDYAPASSVVQLSQVLFSENFATSTGWNIANSAGAVNMWRVGTNAGTATYFGADNCAYISSATGVFTYDPTASASRLQSPAISTLNASNLQLTFDYICNGELDGGVYYDYGTLYYSTDGINYLPINAISYQGTIAKTTLTVPLPAGAENMASLQLGFRWDNDNSVQNQPPFAIDNIVLRGDTHTAAAVQTAVNTGVSADQQYLGPNASVYFYDKLNGNVMARIENLTAFDYGCTSVEVDRAGTGAQYISGDVSGNPKQKLSDKTFRVIPATNSTSGDYRITLYYNAAEKSGYESASTRTWIADNGTNNGTRITKNSGSINSLSTASSGAVSMAESAGAYGTGYTITARFTGGFSGFAAGVPALAVVPATLLDFTATKKENAVSVDWKVAQQLNVLAYEVEHGEDGIHFREAGTVAANDQNNASYNFLHLQPVNGHNFYRLKIIDVNGSFRYSGIAKIEFKVTASIYVTPNPVTDQFTVVYNGTANIHHLSLIDVTGREIRSIPVNGFAGSMTVNGSDLAPGVYIVRLLSTGHEMIAQKFIKR